jgi:tetratricopeptide (TPR) repeat protein
VLKLFEKSLTDYMSIFGNNSSEVASVFNNIGRVYFAHKNYQDTVLFYKESLAIRRAILSEDSIDVIATICGVGQALHRIGELSEALHFYREFLMLSISRKYNKRDIATIAKSAGEIYHKQANLLAAQDTYEHALREAIEGFGNFHPEIASIYNRLGNLYYDTNNLDGALTCYKEGLAIELLALPSCHSRITVTLSNIAQIHYQLGEFEIALERYTQVYNIHLKAHGPRSIEVSKALATMGEMEYKMRHHEKAFIIFQSVLIIQRDHFGPADDGIEVASTLNSIGIVACAQEEYRIARKCFESALTIRMKKLGDHNDTATSWYNLATVNEEIGDDEAAIAMYKECLRIEHSKDASNQKCDAVDSLQRLGRLHQRRGELDEALKYYDDALRKLRARGVADSIAIAKFLNLVGNVHLQRGDVGMMMKALSESSRIFCKNAVAPHEGLVIAGYFMYGLSKLHPSCAAVA